MALYKILSIDGGGIRGVIPAVLLTEMEKRTGKDVYSLFDLIAGTSTGGILAAGLVAPASPDHEPASPSSKFKASDLLALYEEHGKTWTSAVATGKIKERSLPIKRRERRGKWTDNDGFRIHCRMSILQIKFPF